MKHHFSKTTYVVLASAILLAVSTFLPWGSTANHVQNGFVIDGKTISGDGVIMMGIAILTVVMLFLHKIRLANSIIMALGFVAIVVGFIDFFALHKAVANISGEIGVGMYLAILASFGIVFGSAAEISKSKK